MKLFTSKEDKKQIELIDEAIEETLKELESLKKYPHSDSYKEKEIWLTKLYDARAEVKSDIKQNRENLLMAATVALTITNVVAAVIKVKKG